MSARILEIVSPVFLALMLFDFQKQDVFCALWFSLVFSETRLRIAHWREFEKPRTDKAVAVIHFPEPSDTNQ
jgi:hypothetical protein